MRFEYSFDRPEKDEKLSRPWYQLVVLNQGPLDCESSALTTIGSNPLNNTENYVKFSNDLHDVNGL